MSDCCPLASRWVFLITISAILLAIVLITFVVRRRQRALLSLRVARGEVDLEALGIERLHVLQDVLDKMPKYIYTSKSEDAPATPCKPPTRQVQFSQPTCPICLDHFIHYETTIRELPCNHIFHPECIDPVLRGSSSLCPMCKKSVLPPGYCPVNVTNLMVRRERFIRRMRQQNQGASTSPIPAVGGTQIRVGILSTSNTPTAITHYSRVHDHGACNGDAEMINVIGTGNRRPAIAIYHSQNGGRATATTESLTQPQAQDANAEQQYDEHAQEAR